MGEDLLAQYAKLLEEEKKKGPTPVSAPTPEWQTEPTTPTPEEQAESDRILAEYQQSLNNEYGDKPVEADRTPVPYNSVFTEPKPNESVRTRGGSPQNTGIPIDERIRQNLSSRGVDIAGPAVADTFPDMSGYADDDKVPPEVKERYLRSKGIQVDEDHVTKQKFYFDPIVGRTLPLEEFNISMGQVKEEFPGVDRHALATGLTPEVKMLYLRGKNVKVEKDKDTGVMLYLNPITKRMTPVDELGVTMEDVTKDYPEFMPAVLSAAASILGGEAALPRIAYGVGGAVAGTYGQYLLSKLKGLKTSSEELIGSLFDQGEIAAAGGAAGEAIPVVAGAVARGTLSGVSRSQGHNYVAAANAADNPIKRVEEELGRDIPASIGERTGDFQTKARTENIVKNQYSKLGEGERRRKIAVVDSLKEYERKLAPKEKTGAYETSNEVTKKLYRTGRNRAKKLEGQVKTAETKAEESVSDIPELDLEDTANTVRSTLSKKNEKLKGEEKEAWEEFYKSVGVDEEKGITGMKYQVEKGGKLDSTVRRLNAEADHALFSGQASKKKKLLNDNLKETVGMTPKGGKEGKTWVETKTRGGEESNLAPESSYIPGKETTAKDLRQNREALYGGRLPEGSQNYAYKQGDKTKPVSIEGRKKGQSSDIDSVNSQKIREMQTGKRSMAEWDALNKPDPNEKITLKYKEDTRTAKEKTDFWLGFKGLAPKEGGEVSALQTKQALQYLRERRRILKGQRKLDSATERDINALEAGFLETRAKNLTPEQLNLVEAAEAKTAQRKTLFEEGVVGAIMRGGKEVGDYKMEADKVFGQIVKKNSPSRSAAIAPVLHQNPEALQKVREGILRLYKTEYTENGVPTAAKHAQFMKDYGDTIKPYLGEEEVGRLTTFKNLTDLVEAERGKLARFKAEMPKTTLGKAGDFNTDTFIDKVLSPDFQTKDLITTKKVLKKYYPEAYENLQGAVGKRIHDRTFTEDGVNVDALDEILRTKSAHIAELAGPKYVKGLQIVSAAGKRLGPAKIPEERATETVFNLTRNFIYGHLSLISTRWGVGKIFLKKASDRSWYNLVTNKQLMEDYVDLQDQLVTSERALTFFSQLGVRGVLEDREAKRRLDKAEARK